MKYKISQDAIIEDLENAIISLVRSNESSYVHDFLRSRFFSEQDVNETIPHYSDIISNLKYTFSKESKYLWMLGYAYDKQQGTTEIRNYIKFDPNKPSIIFHHGLGDTLSMIQLATVVRVKDFATSNVFVVKAAHHKSNSDFKKNCINKFSSLATITCASVVAIEELIKSIRNQSKKDIILTGISMGGIVTSLHYFTYNSASYYFPINAYPNFGEIMLDKRNKNLVSNYDNIKNNQSIINCFTIKRRKTKVDKIYPIIGIKDTTIYYKNSLKFWEGYQIKTLKSGHFSVVIKRNEVIDHILKRAYFGK